MYTDEELEALQRTAPPSKSKFAQKKFNNASDWCKRFLQEEEFVDHLMKLREDCNLQKVSLTLARLQFAKYKEDGIIDKASFMKEMRELIMKCNGDGLSDNARIKMENTLITLYHLFDIDKNGILKSDEISACLVVLCRGSMAKKIKFGIRVFSSTDTEQEVKIRLGEFSTFLHFIFKLSLENNNEIMLDYPLDKLAKETATAAFQFNKIEDLERGEITLNQVLNYMNKQSSLDI